MCVRCWHTLVVVEVKDIKTYKFQHPYPVFKSAMTEKLTLFLYSECERSLKKNFFFFLKKTDVKVLSSSYMKPKRIIFSFFKTLFVGVHTYDNTYVHKYIRTYLLYIRTYFHTYVHTSTERSVTHSLVQ